MAAITIDDKARFVCVQSFDLGSNDASETVRAVQHAVEQRAPSKEGFRGAVVMANKERSKLLTLSVWESDHAWSAAQYDQEIGRAVTDVVEAATRYEIATYETVTVVRAP